MSPSPPAELVNEFQICHLLYYRSINQHRLSTWWKYFAILHRKLKWMVERPQDGRMIKYIRERLLPKCQWEFHSIIALGQFINLGFTLVGLVAKVDDILAKMYTSADHREEVIVKSVSKPTITPVVVFDDFMPVKKSKVEKKKKKKKAKKAIDDIFG